MNYADSELESSTPYSLPKVSSGARVGNGPSLLVWVMDIFIFLIVFSAYMPVAIQFGSLNIRASQLFLPVAIIALYRGRLGISAKETRLVLVGSLFWLAFIVWTLMNLPSSSSPVVALGHVALLGVNLVHTIVTYTLIVRTKAWRHAAIVFIVSVSFFNALLVFVSLANAAGVSSVGVFLLQEMNPTLINGDVVGDETYRFVLGVLTGNLSVAAGLLALGMLLQPGARKKYGLWIVLVASALGTIIGFSRQSVVSAIGGICLLVFYIVRRRRAGKLVGLTVAVVIICAITLAVSGVPIFANYFQAFAGRAVLLIDADSYFTGTSLSRMEMWSQMLSDVASNPFVGRGQDAYLKYFPSIEGSGSHCFPLEILHATGLSGFIPYLYLHIAILFGGWRLLLIGAASEPDLWLMAGVIAAFVALLLASFTNLIFWGPQYWFLLGLLIAMNRAFRARWSQVEDIK